MASTRFVEGLAVRRAHDQLEGLLQDQLLTTNQHILDEELAEGVSKGLAKELAEQLDKRRNSWEEEPVQGLVT